MEEKEEIWKDVIGYEGRYKVSNMGRVFSVRANKTLSHYVGKNGYCMVSLSNTEKTISKRVHSFVAESFIDSDYIAKGLVVNHKNFKRDDNRLENLEVTTQRENCNRKHMVSSSKYTGVYYTSKKWRAQLRVNGKDINLGSFLSEEEASSYYQNAVKCINEGKVENIVTKRFEPKGYSFEKSNNKWRARPVINGKRYNIGSFNTEKEAMEACLAYKNINDKKGED
jgi:hypothetical protein